MWDQKPNTDREGFPRVGFTEALFEPSPRLFQETGAHARVFDLQSHKDGYLIRDLCPERCHGLRLVHIFTLEHQVTLSRLPFCHISVTPFIVSNPVIRSTKESGLIEIYLDVKKISPNVFSLSRQYRYIKHLHVGFPCGV